MRREVVRLSTDANAVPPLALPAPVNQPVALAEGPAPAADPDDAPKGQSDDVEMADASADAVVPLTPVVRQPAGIAGAFVSSSEPAQSQSTLVDTQAPPSTVDNVVKRKIDEVTDGTGDSHLDKKAKVGTHTQPHESASSSSEFVNTLKKLSPIPAPSFAPEVNASKGVP